MHKGITQIETASKDFPILLKEIPDPPEKIYYRGQLPPAEMKTLAVVGSRNYSDYGKQVVDYLIGGLRGYPVSIISGLALGIDSLAHRTALENNLYTLAIPGSGIDDSVLYPSRHKGLASEILAAGGGLLGEFEPTFKATNWSFPQRNRIMAGLAHAVLVIEATEKSGTLITARMTVDYNRELLVVPGDIFRENTEGPHQFLKLGATPITTPKDILEVFHIDEESTQTTHTPLNLSTEEQEILTALTEPMERDQCIRSLNIDASSANILLMQMELKNLIHDVNGILRKI